MELRIEKIQKDKKRKNIYIITFNNGYSIEILNETLLRSALRSGDLIEEKDINNILLQNQTLEAKNIAMRLLAKRIRSEKEIIDKLKKKNIGDKVISITINELKRIGLVNDKEFVEKFINDSILLQKNISKYALLNKLRQYGISEQLAKESITKLISEDDEYQRALLLASKKIKHLKRFDIAKQRQRIISFLSSKGYNWDIIRKVLNDLKFDYEDNEL